MEIEPGDKVSVRHKGRSYLAEVVQVSRKDIRIRTTAPRREHDVPKEFVRLVKKSRW